MTNLQGQKIILRAVEPSDVKSLYEWENDTVIWGVSGTTTPFSHHTLALFIEAQRQDIFASRQMRLMICCARSQEAVGAVDLFEFDPQNHRVGVGIMIAPAHRKQGFATDALATIERYVTEHLQVHQIWCNVEEENTPSLALFSHLGYTQIGVKRDWNYSPEGYRNEIMMQRIIPIHNISIDDK